MRNSHVALEVPFSATFLKVIGQLLHTSPMQTPKGFHIFLCEREEIVPTFLSWSYHNREKHWVNSVLSRIVRILKLVNVFVVVT